MTSRTERVAQYRAHLRSDLWQTIRERVLDRADGRCELCGAPATEVHHSRYPKQFKDDTEHNALALCSSCHRRIHAMRYERKQVQIQHVPGRGVTHKVRYVVHAGEYGSEHPWIEIEDLKRTLADDQVALVNLGARAFGTIESQMREGAEWEHFEIEDRSTWRAFRFVNEVGAKMLAMAYTGGDAYKRMITLFRDLLTDSVKSRALVAPQPQLPATMGGEWAQPMMQALAKIAEQNSGLLAQHNGLIGEHGQQLQRIEDALPALQDRAQMISVKAGFAERMKVPSTVMSAAGYDGMTAAAYVGEYLTITGAETGQRVIERLDGCSVKTETKTYRREDVHNAIDVAFGLNPPHLREVRRMYRQEPQGVPELRHW